MKAVKFLLGGALVLASVAAGVSQAAATEHHGSGPSTCTGTLTSPGLLAGSYPGNVVVTGFCLVNGGATVVNGDLRLAPGAGLNATFANNDVAGTGTTSLTVKGDIRVESGAVLALGCEPNFSPCADDPAASTGGTLTGHNRVEGTITGIQPLALLVHASKIEGDVTQTGGGGGLSCAVPTTGVFSLIQSPVFSDYEDNTLGGDLTVSGLQTCWFGALRNHISGSVTADRNTMVDPDAGEVLANHVGENVSCFNNSPTVQYGDSMSSPNQVEGSASGECGFKVLQPDPSPTGPPTHISVRS